MVIAPTANAESSIGLYTDATGNTCSFSGDAAGVVTAYVVVRPDINGVSGVQFAAPIPSCFHATFISDVLPPGVVAIGSSQTGISLALPGCAGQPYSVLEINYFRTGGTTPCCAYPIAADPSVGSVIASDCAFQTVPIAPVTSHFNADASCECLGNSSPIPPYGPTPSDHATDAGVHTQLIWLSSDNDNNIVAYDVYFGASPSPPLVATVNQPSYTPETLSPLTPYYWRVVARDAFGLEASGPE
jgi:hypothetical protein